MDILILSDRLTPRVEYTVNHVFGTMLGLSCLYAQSEQEFKDHPGPKFAYSQGYYENALNITPSGLLFETGVEEQSMAFFQWRGLPAFFAIHETSDVPFDLLSASFFLLTRYEEHLPFAADEHGRFPASASYAFRMGFLQLPLVDLWIEQLASILKQQFPLLPIKQQPFTFLPTIDIDNAYAYKHKGLRRALLGTARALVNLRLGEVLQRTLVYTNLLKDPYNTYKFLFRALKSHPQTVWFILAGGSAKWDRNLPVTSGALAKLIKRIGNHFQLGLHPSYHSAETAGCVQTEKAALEQATGKPVELARQHFLRIQFPGYFRNLLANGIKADYSMGYANVVGFRASTCKPFAYFDLYGNAATTLTIVPFALMDRALERTYRNNLQQAIDDTAEMASLVARVGGTFSIAWHNETLVKESHRAFFLRIVRTINLLEIGN